MQFADPDLMSYVINRRSRDGERLPNIVILGSYDEAKAESFKRQCLGEYTRIEFVFVDVLDIEVSQ